jgi:hypothetical protein
MNAANNPPPYYAGHDGKKRPWAGVVRGVPPVLHTAGKCGCMRWVGAGVIVNGAIGYAVLHTG